MATGKARALEVVPTGPEDDVDLSEFEAAAPKKKNLCWFATLLTEEQQQKVAKARAAGHQYDTISKVMEGWGIKKVHNTSLGHHFLGHCGCGK